MSIFHWTAYSTRVPAGNGAGGVNVEMGHEGYEAGATTSSCCTAKKGLCGLARARRTGVPSSSRQASDNTRAV
jgi:hypothetical protein